MTRKTDDTQAVDRHVGQRIRWHRIQRSLSQDELARQLGISYQQLHKYETGSNAVSASRLFEIAEVFGLEAGDFFAHYDTNDTSDWLSERADRETMMMAKYFTQIDDSEQRRAILLLMRSMANDRPGGGY